QAVRLVAVNKVAALLGGTTPEEVEKLDRADKAGVPLLTASWFAPPSVSDYVFFTGLSPAAQGRALARFAAQKWKPEAEDAVLIVDKSREEYQALAAAFARQLLKSKEGTARRWHFDK